MAHMILCAFVGGPADGEVREISDQTDTVRFAPLDPTPVLIAPIM